MKKERRYDLDWLRVMVFALLILYHVGMFFVPWDWHIKNNVISEYIQIPMVFLNQWRLPILFIISGMGTRFALAYRSKSQFLQERTLRLVLPLIFGSLLIVSPQVYIERIVDGAEYTSFFDFYPDFFVGIYPAGNFSWHHLWFLPYLFVYSVILTPVFIYFRQNPDNSFVTWIRNNLQKNAYFIYATALPVWIIEIGLKPFFPVTHALINDWYFFFYFLVLFFYGFLFIAIGDIFWSGLDKIKKFSLIAAICSFLALMAGYLSGLPEPAMTVIRIFNIWNWVLAIFGYAAVHLNRPGKLLTYCNQAVYPFYILHQTITIILAYYVIDYNWPIGIKYLYLAFFTFLISWIIYEFLVKRTPVTRFLFGMKPANGSAKTLATQT